MGETNAELTEFFRAQVASQRKWFRGNLADKFLCFVGSTSSAGVYLGVTAHRLLGIERGALPTELLVRVGGSFAPPNAAAEEIATVTMFEPQGFKGYQVKTRAGRAGAEAVMDDGSSTMVRGGHVFTLHHGPFMLTAFEKVPLDELIAAVGHAQHALVGVGVMANLSPRFCWHHEEADGKLVLFHGDGLPMKTYLNVKANPNVTQVVIDPETFRGFAGSGRIVEFRPEEFPQAYDKICRGFASGGWGKPARVFRFVAERWAPIAPI